jgi:Acyl-coenzyme A synthetases/AMP-(fatty) acid ligases
LPPSLPLQALNACVECCSRHLGGQRLALRAIDADGQRRDYSFEQLDTAAARFANLLATHGIRPGERVAGLLPRTFELLVTILGS